MAKGSKSAVDYGDMGGIVIDDMVPELKPVPITPSEFDAPGSIAYRTQYSQEEMPAEANGATNCLMNKRVIVRHIPSGPITDPKHVLSGGMGENARRVFSVPRLTSGLFVDVLTKNEKAYLEHVMGLEPNALSIYKKVENFWDDSNAEGISSVTLGKQDNYLNLAKPDDYIRYKILLANKDSIAPSKEEYLRNPKPTYQYYILVEGEEDSLEADNMEATIKCYELLNKLKDHKGQLRVVAETLIGKRMVGSVQVKWVMTECNKVIKRNPKAFLKVAEDDLLPAKVLIRSGVEEGVVSYRNGLYYLTEGNVPLCKDGENPDLTTAAIFIGMPKNQQIKFMIEERVKND